MTTSHITGPSAATVGTLYTVGRRGRKRATCVLGHHTPENHPVAEGEGLPESMGDLSLANLNTAHTLDPALCSQVGNQIPDRRLSHPQTLCGWPSHWLLLGHCIRCPVPCLLPSCFQSYSEAFLELTGDWVLNLSFRTHNHSNHCDYLMSDSPHQTVNSTMPEPLPAPTPSPSSWLGSPTNIC